MQWQKSVGKRRLLRQPAASHRSSHWKWSFIRPFLSFPSPYPLVEEERRRTSVYLPARKEEKGEGQNSIKKEEEVPTGKRGGGREG